MHHPILTIGRYTMLEAWRTRLPLLAAGVIALIAAASGFAHQIAITESGRVLTAIYASGTRLAIVFVASMYVLASVVREFNDKGIDIALATDLPRTDYLLGKLGGFLVIAACLAAAAALPLAAVAPPEAALQWGISLALELAVVVAFALFGIITLAHLAGAASCVLAFYLLARTMAALRLMSAYPMTGADAPAQQAMRAVVETLALVIPSFDRWTQTAWLVNEPARWQTIGILAAEATLYIALLAAAAAFDFCRRNF